MKELLLFLFALFSFFSFTKETIIYNKELVCPYDISTTLPRISQEQKDFYKDLYYYESYGFNAQNCGIRKKKPTNTDPRVNCCYINLLFNDNLYNFCAEVQSKEHKTDLIDSVINDLNFNLYSSLKEEDKEDIKEKLKKGLSIDCFSKKPNIVKIIIFISLILII